MNDVNALFGMLAGLLIMSYAAGIIIGTLTGKGFAIANTLVKWEVTLLCKAIRFTAGLLLQVTSDIFGNVAKKVNPPKKKKKRP